MDSVDRIATTHVGSLPRSEMVSDVVLAIEQGAAVSEELFDAVISDAVDVAVASQKKIGIDIVSDGEFSKATYASYVQPARPHMVTAQLDETCFMLTISML